MIAFPRHHASREGDGDGGMIAATYLHSAALMRRRKFSVCVASPVKNYLREVRSSLEMDKPLVLVQEADPAKGGGTRLRARCVCNEGADRPPGRVNSLSTKRNCDFHTSLVAGMKKYPVALGGSRRDGCVKGRPPETMNTAPTNLEIPREVMASWEREADAAKPTRRECGCDSWKEYVEQYGIG
mmetsp:Transcript_20513/g.61572  ORF Transcript_20513/g.61572 Transcript_20513/m.61572 type:complete len:184 (+) Transcript_20513:187-738(+)